MSFAPSSNTPNVIFARLRNFWIPSSRQHHNHHHYEPLSSTSPADGDDDTHQDQPREINDCFEQHHQDQDQDQAASSSSTSTTMTAFNSYNDASKAEVVPTTTATAMHSINSSENNNNIINNNNTDAAVSEGIHILESKSVHFWSYFATVDFWAVIAVGQVLSLCITGTNTFTSFLAGVNTNIPAFQTLFNYVLLFIVYTAILLWHDGPRAWWRIACTDGWKYLIMSFLDVEGNYFTVLAYRYTNLLSAQLLNFWSIVCVVIISFLLLRVRYKIFQVIGILICCGGMGILLASDHITGANGGPAADLLKGDLFGLLGATLYGVSNVFEEWLVSKRPMYHVLAFMGLFGTVINGVQAAIFDRSSFQGATWDGSVAGWLVGYTLCLFIFYTLAPLILRMGSAAFFDISLLTANFWGVIIGIHVFGLTIHYLYPIAFVCIIIGLVIYFLAGSLLGDSKKPWLGANQEDGVAGFGTAKLKALNAARKAQMGGSGPEAGINSTF